MAKAKKSTKSKKKANVKKSATLHGIDHDFVLIAGGGFVLIVLIAMFLAR